MKKNVLLLAGLGILVIFLVIFFSIRYADRVSRKQIVVSGNIEARESRLSFQIAGKIVERLTDEGRFARKDDVLARLDKEELIRIKQQYQANLVEAESNCKFREKEYNRIQSIFPTNAISEQDRDRAQNAFEVSKAQIEAIKKAIELTNVRLDYTDLKSPADCFVLVRNAEVGEVLQPGNPVFTVVDLNDIWLTAYINETDLGRVKLNQNVEIKTDTYPNKAYKGRISFISEEAEFTPKQIQTTQERVKLVYRIKVDIENSNLELKMGMPADGYIKVE